MKPIQARSLLALTLFTLLNACQAIPLDTLIVPMSTASPKGPGPASGPIAVHPITDHSIVPTDGATIGPTGSPGSWYGPTSTPWPSDASYPTVTPTPGTESVYSFSNADVAARREHRRLTLYKPSPDGKRSLYAYESTLEADFKGWVYNPATRSLSSELRLREADGSDRLLGQPELQTGSDVYWIDDHRLAWVSPDTDTIFALDLELGTRSSLYTGQNLNRLRQQGAYLFFTDTVGGHQRLVRLNPLTGERRSVELPYADYYSTVGDVHPLGPDLALVGQVKSSSRAGAYPFRVMMTATPDPPLSDSYLVDLANSKVEPLKFALDLNKAEKVQPAADGRHYLIQKAAGALVFNRAGALVLQADGRAVWLDAERLLVLESSGLRILSLSDQVTLYRASTQALCTAAAAAAGRVLVQCNAEIEGQRSTRVYAIAAAGGAMLELALQLPAAGAAELTPEGRILTRVPGLQGSSKAWRLDEQGQPQPELELANPADPQFVFDPNKDYWAPSYGS